MEDHWEDRAVEAHENIEMALERLKFVEAIVFDGDQRDRFDRAFWDLRSLGTEIERQLEED